MFDKLFRKTKVIVKNMKMKEVQKYMEQEEFMKKEYKRIIINIRNRIERRRRLQGRTKFFQDDTNSEETDPAVLEKLKDNLALSRNRGRHYVEYEKMRKSDENLKCNKTSSCKRPNDLVNKQKETPEIQILEPETKKARKEIVNKKHEEEIIDIEDDEVQIIEDEIVIEEEIEIEKEIVIVEEITVLKDLR